MKIDKSVSILILLDYLLLYYTSSHKIFITASLNPYFIGLSTLIWRQFSGTFNMQRKSQSLFYWIIYSYERTYIVHLAPAKVSILILLDYLLLLYSSFDILNCSSWSQSLFYWIIYSYKRKNAWSFS